jgi:hypothetical protein
MYAPAQLVVAVITNPSGEAPILKALTAPTRH